MAQFFQTVRTLSAAGQTPHIAIKPEALIGPAPQPGIVATLSPGAVMTYNIEITGDNVAATGYNDATGNWQPMATALAGLNASTVATLGACVSGIRVNVTDYTSGTINLTLVQLLIAPGAMG